MNRKGSLICITGIDGSGKTTLAKELTGRFRTSGYPAEYHYGRVKPVIARILMWMGRTVLLRKKKSDIFEDYHQYTSDKRKLFKKKILSDILTFSLLFDQIIQINLTIRPKILAGRLIFCDRYIADTVITDIAPDNSYSSETAGVMIRKISLFVPEPYLTLFVEIPEEIAYQRKTDIPHLHYLTERSRIYRDLLKGRGVYVLDGSKARDEIAAAAFDIVTAALEGDEHFA